MKLFAGGKKDRRVQYLVSIASITVIAAIAYFSAEFTGYKVVALTLLLVVSILAMIFDIWPVVVAAIYSALIWNFFFIPPLFELAIGTPEDALLFLMYFVIAMLNAVLTSKIRKAEMKTKEEEERKNTISLYNTVLNSLSHELKTPISTIIGAIDSLKENPSRLSADNKRELFSEIDIASMRLNRQVENLLSMSRLESGFIKPKFDWCDMEEMVHRVIHHIEFKPSAHLIEFEAGEEIPLFKLDRGLIEQALHNILHNAIQYTPPGSTIRIKIKYQKQSCIIIISDDGPGFPEKELASVFKKFYRLPNTISGGTGLGLSIVKGFIEAHQGTIILQNQPNGGAKFTITLPADVSYIKDIQHEQSGHFDH